jgi:hypothetical protein
MRICPICHRTYEDDTLVFCLDDGTRLSAAYDPHATPARATDPERTAIVPPESPRPRSTIPSPPLTYSQNQRAQVPGKRNGRVWMALSGVSVLAVFGLIVVAGFFAWQARDNSNPEPARVRSTPPTDTSDPANTNRRAAPAPTANPELDWLDGVWSGEGYQTDTKTTWVVRLTARDRTYSIDYPDIPCRGKWDLIDKNSREATFTEVIAQGTDRCGNNGHVMVEKVSASEISCRFTHAGSRAVIATVVLSKKAE